MKTVKLSCEIIKDLLPLYVDGVVSEESKKLLEEHFAECNNCQELAEQMQLNVKKEQETNLVESEALNNLSKKWNRKLFFSMLKGILSTLAFVLLTLAIIYIFVGIEIG
jgi:predicted anti-sigma-YlaC factor YlaD